METSPMAVTSKFSLNSFWSFHCFNLHGLWCTVNTLTSPHLVCQTAHHAGFGRSPHDYVTAYKANLTPLWQISRTSHSWRLSTSPHCDQARKCEYLQNSLGQETRIDFSHFFPPWIQNSPTTSSVSSVQRPTLAGSTLARLFLERRNL